MNLYNFFNLFRYVDLSLDTTGETLKINASHKGDKVESWQACSLGVERNRENTPSSRDRADTR